MGNVDAVHKETKTEAGPWERTDMERKKRQQVEEAAVRGWGSTDPKKTETEGAGGAK